MKYILTEETLLLQKRANIITEGQYKTKLKEILLEDDTESLIKDPKILALAAKIVKQPVDKVEDKVEDALAGKEDEKTEVNEALALTIALALPMILEAGGSLSNLLKRNYGLDKEKAERYGEWKKLYKQSEERLKNFKKEKNEEAATKEKKQQEELIKTRDKEFGTKFGENLKKAGHGLHELYTSPVRALLWVISKFTPKDSDLRDKKIREKIANIVYAAGMVVFAGFGIFESLQNLPGISEAATAILDGAKGGKSAAEIIADVPLVAKAFAS
jgi:hypothetical protein